MTGSSGKTRTAFSENEVRSILARAAELESSGNGGMISAADLRKIAAEAGIDSATMERAIAEAERGPATSPVREQRSELLRILTAKNLGMVVAGGTLAAMAVAADGGRFGSLTAVAIFGPSALFAAWRALHHRHWGSVRGLSRELAPLFGSFVVTIATLAGQEGFAAALVWGAICSAGAVSIANREDRPARVSTPTPPG